MNIIKKFLYRYQASCLFEKRNLHTSIVAAKQNSSEIFFCVLIPACTFAWTYPLCVQTVRRFPAGQFMICIFIISADKTFFDKEAFFYSGTSEIA